MPSDRVQFLSLEEVLAIHERVIQDFGGASGVRDLGLLESALYRPQSGYYEDLVTMAAALFESLLMNHPFVDGNKRVAFFATDVFLRLNGFRLEVGRRRDLRLAHRVVPDWKLRPRASLGVDSRIGHQVTWLDRRRAATRQPWSAAEDQFPEVLLNDPYLVDRSGFIWDHTKDTVLLRSLVRSSGAAGRTALRGTAVRRRDPTPDGACLQNKRLLATYERKERQAVRIAPSRTAPDCSWRCPKVADATATPRGSPLPLQSAPPMRRGA